MKPLIKSIDLNSDRSWQEMCLGTGGIFGFWITASIGSDLTKGADDFRIFVCTQAWLDEQLQEGSKLEGKYFLVNCLCDPEDLIGALNTYLGKCAAESWDEVAKLISRIGHWEFEDYQP